MDLKSLQALVSDTPEHLTPCVCLGRLNQRVRFVDGPFDLLTGSTNTTLNGNIYFKWLPTAGVEFEGTLAAPFYSCVECGRAA